MPAGDATKEEQKNLYEGMYIVTATLSETARTQAFERLQSDITSRGGEIVKVIDMGRKKFAYNIRKQREGYYHLIYFKSAPSTVKELWSEYRLNEDLLRFVTLRTDAVLENLEFKSIEMGSN